MAEDIVEDLGRWAEQKARELLELENYQYVNQNYHSRYGEIDLIVRSGKELVFVEVKARSLGSYASACEVITRAQQRKIIKTAQFFLQKHPNYDDFDCRFDVICFDFPKKFAKTVQPDFSKLQYDQQWIQHAFTLD
ncbi:YraN family protein [Acinetobacter sp. LF10]|uniref:YraN family protein n=1 Tax=Acinetobacter TaxID=469 RepID=UPI00202EECC5|nr:YraN family protein [Acinetobacter modestus]MCM1958066.1 YraN family protein [Acinetobacter modestus]